jgi:hypothetical protein
VRFVTCLEAPLSALHSAPQNLIGYHNESAKQTQECRVSIPTFAIAPCTLSRRGPNLIVLRDMHDAEATLA